MKILDRILIVAIILGAIFAFRLHGNYQRAAALRSQAEDLVDFLIDDRTKINVKHVSGEGLQGEWLIHQPANCRVGFRTQVEFGNSNHIRRSSSTAAAEYPFTIGLKKMDYGWVLRTNISGRKEINLGETGVDFSNPHEFRIKLAKGETTIGNRESLPLFEVYEAAASQPCISVALENGFPPRAVRRVQVSSLFLGGSQNGPLNEDDNPPSNEPILRVDKPWHDR